MSILKTICKLALQTANKTQYKCSAKKDQRATYCENGRLMRNARKSGKYINASKSYKKLYRQKRLKSALAYNVRKIIISSI